MWVLGRANPWLGVVLGDAPHTAMLPDLGLPGKLGPGVDDDRVSWDVTTGRTLAASG